jgi:hypothetical protein
LKTLDLHGFRHHEVDRVVENFVLLEELPVRVIPGNSPIMQSLVKAVLERHDLKFEVENFLNVGSWIIRS